MSNHNAPSAGAPAGAVLLAVKAFKSTSALITIARFAAPKNESVSYTHLTLPTILLV